MRIFLTQPTSYQSPQMKNYSATQLHNVIAPATLYRNNIGDTTSFGMAFGEKKHMLIQDDYEQVENFVDFKSLRVCSFGTYLKNANIDETLECKNLGSDGIITAKNIEVDGAAELKDVNVAETLSTREELTSTGTLKAKNIVVKGEADLKDANVAETLSVYFRLRSDGTLTAKNIRVENGAFLNNANVAETLEAVWHLGSSGKITAKDIIIRQGGVDLHSVNAQQIISQRHVSLNEIEKLDSIAIIEDSFTNENSYRTLTFKNTDAHAFKKKPIDVLIGDIEKLIIKTPEGDHSILNKLRFYEAKVKNVYSNLSINGVTKASEAFSHEKIQHLIKCGIINIVKI